MNELQCSPATHLASVLLYALQGVRHTVTLVPLHSTLRKLKHRHCRYHGNLHTVLVVPLRRTLRKLKHTHCRYHGNLHTVPVVPSIARLRCTYSGDQHSEMGVEVYLQLGLGIGGLTNIDYRPL